MGRLEGRSVGYALFFLLTFGSVTVDQIQIGAPGNVNINSPYALLQTVGIMNVFGIFVLTAFVANVVIRDDETGFAPIVRSTRVTKFDYLVGRFFGAWLVALLVMTSVPIAIFALISFSLGRYIPGMQGIAGLALMTAGVTVLFVTVDSLRTISDIVFIGALLLPPYVLGRITRRLWIQRQQLEAQQQLIKDQAIRDERDRIARELHDVVAPFDQRDGGAG